MSDYTDENHGKKLIVVKSASQIKQPNLQVRELKVGPGKANLRGLCLPGAKYIPVSQEQKKEYNKDARELLRVAGADVPGARWDGQDRSDGGDWTAPEDAELLRSIRKNGDRANDGPFWSTLAVQVSKVGGRYRNDEACKQRWRLLQGVDNTNRSHAGSGGAHVPWTDRELAELRRCRAVVEPKRLTWKEISTNVSAVDADTPNRSAKGCGKQWAKTKP